jgi:hypothetical protein
MKTTGLTTLGYESSALVDFLFRSLIRLTRWAKVTNFAEGNGPRDDRGRNRITVQGMHLPAMVIGT